MLAGIIVDVSTSFTEHFIRMGASATRHWSFRLDSADFLATGKIVPVLEVETASCVKRPSSFLIFTLNRIFLTSAVDTDSGWFSGGGVDFTADSLWSRSKQAVFKRTVQMDESAGELTDN